MPVCLGPRVQHLTCHDGFDGFNYHLPSCACGVLSVLLLAESRTGKDQDTIREDLMRDNFMSAEQVGVFDGSAGLNMLDLGKCLRVTSSHALE